MCSIRFDIGHDLSEYPTSCDSVIKESLITAVDCGISQSTFSPEVSNRGGMGGSILLLFYPVFGGFGYESVRDNE